MIDEEDFWQNLLNGNVVVTRQGYWPKIYWLDECTIMYTSTYNWKSFKSRYTYYELYHMYDIHPDVFSFPMSKRYK